MDALSTEAREMALNIINGNRGDVRDFIKGHDTPASLSLAIVRHLIGEGEEPMDAIVNVQSLLSGMGLDTV